MRDLATIKTQERGGLTRTGRPDPVPETAQEREQYKRERAEAMERRRRLNGWRA